MKTFYDLIAKTWDNKEFHFKQLKGKPCLIVNIASKCGLKEGSFKKLNKIVDKDINILLFPCNQFLNQEPLNIDEIHEYVEKESEKYILFEKVKVFGKEKHEVYEYLTENFKSIFGNFIKWNYTMFLIDKDGNPIKRYEPKSNIFDEKLKMVIGDF